MPSTQAAEGLERAEPAECSRRIFSPLSLATGSVARACQECNRKKTKCDMKRPICGLCQRTGNISIPIEAEATRHLPLAAQNQVSDAKGQSQPLAGVDHGRFSGWHTLPGPEHIKSSRSWAWSIAPGRVSLCFQWSHESNI